MTTVRQHHTATLLSDGRVLVTGGAVASAEIYNPAQGTWSPTGAMITARRWHTATRLPDGRVLVAGGYTESSGSLASVEIYDPTLGTWAPAGVLSTARSGHTATRLSDGRVLVTGGAVGGAYDEYWYEYDAFVDLATADLYDPALGTWSPTGAMSTTHRWHTTTRLSNGRVLLTGGTGETGGTLAEIYDPALGTWSLTGSMSTPHNTHTATLLLDGRVLVAGGGGDDSVTVAEIYNPVQGTWSLTGSLTTPRLGHTATRLSDGRVLVTGASWGLGSAEIYDPTLGTWSLTDPLSTSREYHTATLLSDNRVLVVGGYDQRSQAILATAERYSSHATPPEVSCGAADGVWHSSDVSIACLASDPESGLANAADASLTLTTNWPMHYEYDNVATNSRPVCNTIGDCTLAGPIMGNKVDKQVPVISLTSPWITTTQYEVGATVNATYSCHDGGSGLASCQGPVANGTPFDTSSIGIKTFTVTATDNVGHSHARSNTYSVVYPAGSTPADVGITLSAPKRIPSGGTLTYAIAVRNASGTPATGIVVSDAIPVGTLFARASSSQGTITAPAIGSNGTVAVNLGNLPANGSASISIVVTVTAKPGIILNDTATVSATTQDLNGSNNSATVKTTVSKN